MTRKDLDKVPRLEKGPTQDASQKDSPAPDAAGAPDETPTQVVGPEPLAVIGAAGEAASADATDLRELGPGPEPESDEDVEARLAMESLMRHRKQRRRKKIIAGGVIGGIALVALIAWGVVSAMGSSQQEAPMLSTIPLMRGEFSESVQATGTAEPLSSVVVTPEVTGIIDAVNVAEGSTVTEGDVLLTIKNDDLDKAVREAEIAVRSAQADVAGAQSAYNQTYKDYKAGPTTMTDGDGNTVTVPASTTWADVEKAQTQIDSAKLTLENAQGAYDEAVAMAGKRTVYAPASGSVVVMNAVSGAAVGSGGGAGTGEGSGTGSLIQIADLSQMTVKVQVNEVDISKIAVGQAARVTFSALPGVQLDAQVTRISTVASGNDQYGYSYGVVTYDVELLIPEPVPELKPGMTANVEILMQNVPDALTVPLSALGTDDGENYYVYVMTDPETQACERRDVTVTAQSQTEAVIEGDVSEGDLVALDPYLAMTLAAGDGTDTAGLAAGDVPSDHVLDEDLAEGDAVATTEDGALEDGEGAAASEDAAADSAAAEAVPNDDAPADTAETPAA